MIATWRGAGNWKWINEGANTSAGSTTCDSARALVLLLAGVRIADESQDFARRPEKSIMFFPPVPTIVAPFFFFVRRSDIWRLSQFEADDETRGASDAPPYR